MAKPKKQPTGIRKPIHHVRRAGAHVAKRAKPHAKKVQHWYFRRSFWQRVGIVSLLSVFLFVSSMYGLAQWYMFKHRSEPLTIGSTFIPSYARWFDMDPKQTMQAMIDDLGIRRFRLVSYWDEIEKTPGNYDFSELDWQFDKVEQAGGTVSLALGLRQPRWPECHWPEWAQKLPKKQWRQELKDVMGAVINRYKNRPFLESYQLENEYFLEVFGRCPDHSRERLVDEFNYVKSLDPDRTLIVTRSNNAVPSWPVGAPRADRIGASIYKRVWDGTVTKRYFEYPLPPWFYAMLAGGAELTTGRDTIIHEMQAEPWTPVALRDASIEEQDKSLSAEGLRDRIKYGVDTGLKTIDLWGVEWWYWRKIKLHDPSVWDAGKAAIEEFTTADKQCSSYYANPESGRSRVPC